jgi:hypothetical protein
MALLHLGLGAGALGDQAVMLDAPVLLEMKSRSSSIAQKSARA